MVVTDERGLPVSAGGLAQWLRRIAPARARGAVAVAIVSDARSRALNRQYRGRDYATDVLSFPALTPEPRSPIPDRRPAPYSDIVIARGVTGVRRGSRPRQPTVARARAPWPPCTCLVTTTNETTARWCAPSVACGARRARGLLER